MWLLVLPAACRATVLARLVVVDLIMALRQLGAAPAIVYRLDTGETDRPHCTVSLACTRPSQ